MSPARVARRLVVPIAVVAALVTPWLACGTPDECDAGAATCDGNIAASCSVVADNYFFNHNEWRRKDCSGRSCALVKSGRRMVAICTLGDGPDARCPAESTSSTMHCSHERATVLSCRYGHLVEETECEPPKTCVELGPPSCPQVAFCTDDAERAREHVGCR